MNATTLESILRIWLHARNRHDSLRDEMRAAARRDIAALRIARRFA